MEVPPAAIPPASRPRMAHADLTYTLQSQHALASQIELSETEFNDLVDEGELDFVHKIADVVAVLEQLPPPPPPLPPVPPPQPPPPPPLPPAECHNPGAAGAAAHGPEGQGASPAPLALAAVPP